MTSKPLSADSFAQLQRAVIGRVSTPADADWDERRKGWKREVDQQPVAVVEAANVDDIVSVVRFAAEAGLAVAAQPGGHGATRAVDGAILLRTTALDEISIDTAARLARVGAGVKWGTLLTALDGTGLTGLAGSNPDVTVVGYSLAAGLSWFGRAYGLGAQAVRAVELVDATGQQRRVTEDSDPELLWALRGGGGDFGIVTSIEITLFPAPTIYGGKLTFPVEDARAVLHAFAATNRTAPPELTLWARLMHIPSIPQLPEAVRGRSFAVVDATYLGEQSEGERLLADIRAAGTVLADSMGPVPLSQLDKVAAEPTDPRAGLDSSMLLRAFDDDTIDRLLVAGGDRRTTAITAVQVRALGGAIAEGDAQAGAVGAIAEPYLLICVGILPVPELAGPIRAGFAAVRDAMRPESTGRTALPFLPAGEGLDRVYDPDRLARLRAVKQRVDPRGVIRSNNPVLGT